MKHHQPAFKETQLFDWESEPATERSSSFFLPSDFESAVPARRVAKRRGISVVWIACAVVIGIGCAILVEAPRYFHLLNG